MARYQVLIRYEHHKAFMKYDSNIQNIIEDKFGEMGATDIERYHMSPNFPLLLVTTYAGRPSPVPY
ncbi:uncharacterized protein ACHE_30849A [Aspergillus chevalieri]|uniref:Uncharacterized protein n=1 Tax=Aspergillus chevalieri TaxID=182096 RepID=A0A7R7VLF2_ASPCH|nr:uncharacterized protein ACHE_30849A [Aspergillus chevalieri]BCR86862.1 hypothetical protein ACHE_30849A [Aspergillus chevalieri]